jgi:hypothetical protein
MCAGERGHHTRGVSRACWASHSKLRYFRSESRPYSMWRNIVESAPKSGSSSIPHPQRARKSQRLHGNTVSGCTTCPLAFCLTDRSAIRDKSPIERTTVGASGPVPATVRSGRLGWLPLLEKGRPTKPLIVYRWTTAIVFNRVWRCLEMTTATSTTDSSI